MVAWKYLPSRAEPLYEIAKHYRIANQFEKGYKYAKLGSTIPFPKNQVLFLFKSVYDYQILDELAICASYIGKIQESISLCERILRENYLPPHEIPRIQKNMGISQIQLLKLKESPNKKKIVFYVGYAIFDSKHIYGSELACINLCKQLSIFYNIYVFGQSLKEEIIDGIPFLNSSNLESFMNNNLVEVLIISRYVNYIIEFPLRATKIFIWLHDVCYHGAYNGNQLPNSGKNLVRNVLENVNNMGIVTLSQWHHDLVVKTYDLPEKKVSIIGNAINETHFEKYVDFDIIKKEKIPFRFIYTSDACRGLEQLVEYFDDIKKEFPLSELYIYRDIKSFENYSGLLEKINKNKSIHYKGKLDQKDLVLEFIKSDIWLYPTSFSETYCMSGLEALRSGCYCIATNLAALKDTIGDRGVLIDGDAKNPEIKQIFLNEVRKVLTNDDLKISLQKKAFEWAKTQTWNKVGKEWLKLIQ
jgi:glycosyltransferase involved in cell wall biosynthesis